MHLSVDALLKRLRLEMPVQLTLEDPLTQQPMSCNYENLHQLLALNLDNLSLEEQLVTNLYAEMGRFQRAAEYAQTVATARYAKWKSQKAVELADKQPPKKTAAGKPAARQGPTQAEVEAYYRDQDDYEELQKEPARLAAIAGIMADLKRAFEIKSRMASDQVRTLGAYEKMARDHDSNAQSQMETFEALAAEANQIASASVGELDQFMRANPPPPPGSPPPPPPTHERS